MTAALIVGLSGTALTADERRFLKDVQPAGLILFSRNCETREQITALVRDARAAIGSGNLLVLIDQEGGRVQRLRPPLGRLLPPGQSYADLYANDPEAAKIAGKVDRDFLRMASIGAWPPIEISDDPALKLPGQQYPTVTKWLAREASIVPIGANHNAIRLYDRDGNLLNTTDPAAFISLADNYSPKPKTMKKIILLLNAISGLQLVDTATEDEVAVQLNDVVSTNTRLASENQTLQSRVDELTSAETTRQKTGFIALIDAAVKSGRMSASGRDAMMNLFDKDPQNAATALEALPVPQSVTRQIEKAAQNGQNNTELSDITAKDWNTLDKEGKLTTLKDKYPDLYKEKFKTRFGTEPNL